MLTTCRPAMRCGLFMLVMGTVPIDALQNAADKDHLRGFAGTWKAPEYIVPASSELDIAVWGKDASKVRNIELSIEPDGDGILKVHNSVVDRRGRATQYSASVVEARLKLEAPAKWDDKRIEPRVTVIAAEERYLDGTNDKIAIEGLKVSINSMTNMQAINMRYDTAQGTGSFGETLTRQSPRRAKPGVRRSLARNSWSG